MSFAISASGAVRPHARDGRHRLAFIVSHPIQYYVPLYQRLSQRHDISIKVFFTWHDGSEAVQDRGFGIPLAWDIPLTQGYEFEAVENVSADPGTHHFLGLRNPSLVTQVLAWRPTIIHITGWAWWSHLQAMRAFERAGYPTLFRGDSHLLNQTRAGPKWWLKRAALKHIYRWPSAFLVTGQANQAYYRAFGVEPERLTPCPHSIDYLRFSENDSVYEREAQRWRRELEIDENQIAFLFAGKFERGKDPIGFMRAVASLRDSKVVAVMVGGGALQNEVQGFARLKPDMFRVLPFQNQSRMPIVYRLGDVFVMPSHGETWGLAVNEALACGRPALVSERVGCAVDVIDGSCGQIFPENGLADVLRYWSSDKTRLISMRTAASARGRRFDIHRTEAALVEAIEALSKEQSTTP